MLGDREDAQLKAIEMGAAALVVTGDLLVSARTLASAQKQGVMVISTAHHTFTAVRLINLSISTQDIMNREFNYCHPEDQMSEVQQRWHGGALCPWWMMKADSWAISHVPI